MYEWADWGTYKSYYGMHCAAGPVNIDGNFTSPVYSDCATCMNHCFDPGTEVKRKLKIEPQVKGASKVTQTCCSGTVTVKNVAFLQDTDTGKKGNNAYNNPNHTKGDGGVPNGNPPQNAVKRKKLGPPIKVVFAVDSEIYYAHLRLFSVEVKANGERPALPIQVFAVGQEVKKPGNTKNYHSVPSENVETSPDGRVVWMTLGAVTYQVVLDNGT
jgi:hypothetical protein